MSKPNSSNVVVTEDPKTHVITVKGVMTVPPQMKAFVESSTNPKKKKEDKKTRTARNQTKTFRRKRKQPARPSGSSSVIYTEHPQVAFRVVNPKRGKYTIVCDEKMVDVVRTINEFGVRTFFSCQGDDDRADSSAYLVTEYPNQRDFRKIVRVLEDHWKDRFITIEIDSFSRHLRMVFRAHHCVPNDLTDPECPAMPYIYLHRPDDASRWDGSEWEKGGNHVQ